MNLKSRYFIVNYRAGRIDAGDASTEMNLGCRYFIVNYRSERIDAGDASTEMNLACRDVGVNLPGLEGSCGAELIYHDAQPEGTGDRYESTTDARTRKANGGIGFS